MLDVLQIHEPRSVGEASELVVSYGSDAALYAGGTELLLLLKLGVLRVPHLIDLKTIPDLDEVLVDEEEGLLRLGALVTHRRILKSANVRETFSLLAEVAGRVGNPRVRAAGTLGGNLCFAEPHSDPATLLLAADASLLLQSARGQREVPLQSFFLGLLETVRQPEEVLTEIRVPLPSAYAGGGYERFPAHNRRAATLAALLDVQGGIITRARLAAGGIGLKPVRLTRAEGALVGVPASGEAFAEAGSLAASEIDPLEDPEGSEAYKRNIVRTLTYRALHKANRRAGERAADA